MTVAHDHAAVESVVPGRTGRNHFDFGGFQIQFIHVIVILQIVEHPSFDRVFQGLLLLVGEFFFLFVTEIGVQRDAARQDIQVFPGDDFAGLLPHLLSGQVDQQVADAENRIIRFFADVQCDHGTVLPGDYAVECHRPGDPLVFLDPAVIMGVQHRQVRIFIQRILFQVQPRGIDVGPQDVHAVFNRVCSDLEDRQSLAHVAAVDPVPRFQFLAGSDEHVQIHESVSSQFLYHIIVDFPLRLAAAEEVSVFSCEGIDLTALFVVILFPCGVSLHNDHASCVKIEMAQCFFRASEIVFCISHGAENIHQDYFITPWEKSVGISENVPAFIKMSL